MGVGVFQTSAVWGQIGTVIETGPGGHSCPGDGVVLRPARPGEKPQRLISQVS